MNKHVTVLGFLFILFNISGLLIGILFLLTFLGVGIIGAFSIKDYAILPIMLFSKLGWLVAGGFIALSLPGVIAGAGLIRFKSWARTLALILAVLNLVNLPIGTLLAIYTFIVLLQPGIKKYFK